MNRNGKLILLVVFCALVGGTVPATAQEPIGRLFFTPAQRSSLDVARIQRARATLSTERVSEEAAPVAQTITYDGMVRRSDGKSTVWINNRPVNDQEPVSGATLVGRVRADGSVSLQIPQSGRSVDLKPGQSIELLSGAVEESYSRRPVQAETKPAIKPPAGTKDSKPVEPERSKAERDRDEQERLQEAVAKALQDSGGAKPGAVPPPAPVAEPR